MPAERFVEQLNIQIGHEFAAHQQYVACAVYYDALTMPQMAGFFYDQALEEYFGLKPPVREPGIPNF